MSLFLLAFACTDYNLSTPAKTEPEPDEEGEPEPEPEPEPSEDPDIEVTPESIDFGYVMKDCPSDPLTVTIKNVGLAKLVVSDIELDGEAAAKFKMDGAPTELAYDEEYTFEIEFEPSAYVVYEVGVTVTSNDPDEGEVGVPVVGTGASGSIFEESFEQTYIDEDLDVLWIVDNSGSMDESLKRLNDQFDLFINAFISLGLDYHIGVVTTDMDNPAQSGKLQGSPLYIDTSTSNPEREFSEVANVGSGGSGDERGLDASKNALSSPLVTTDNAGFLRSGSVLSVIVVSDENDSSNVSTGSYTSWINSLRSDPDYTSFNAIVGDRGLGCSSGDIWTGDFIEAMGGDKYLDVATATGGFFASICTEDFDVAVTNMARSSAGMKSSFELAKTPSDLSQMEVYVDGVLVPYDSFDGWSYDSSTNSVQFHGDAYPDGGSIIEVSYPYDSTCN